MLQMKNRSHGQINILVNYQDVREVKKNEEERIPHRFQSNIPANCRKVREGINKEDCDNCNAMNPIERVKLVIDIVVEEIIRQISQMLETS